MSARTVKLKNGPLKGRIYEIDAEFPIPEKILFVDEDRRLRHWYDIEGRDTDEPYGVFVRSDPY